MIVDRFFHWVRDASADRRCRVVEPLVRAFAEASPGGEDRETLVAALTVLAGDPEPAVRRRLAEELATCDDAPRHLLLDLLWDDPAIAEPVALRSEALIEAELVEVAATAHPDVAFALARRRRVGPGLAGALSETVDRRGAVALLANAGADLTAAVLLRLIDRFGEFAVVREALAGRSHVPVTVRHRVLEKLAETMGEIVVLGRAGGAARGRALARDAKDRATVSLAAAASGAEVTVLVDHLRHTGQLTTRLVLRAVCVGELRFVEEAIAVLAEVPVRRVSALVADGRESAFRALYARTGMPERAFPAFAAALEVHRELLRETGGLDGRPGDRARFSGRLVERVLTRIEMPARRDADDLLALLRRFAADAAREQARAVAAERMRTPPTLALVAPVAVETPVEAEDAAEVALEPMPVAPAPEIRVDAARDRLDEVAPMFSIEDAIAEAAAIAVEAARGAPTPPPADELDEPVGLFSHVRLEDVPPEWLNDEGEDDAVMDADADRFENALRGSLAA